MTGIRWARVLVGVLAGVVFTVLLLGLVVAVVMALGQIGTIADVQRIPRFTFVTSLIVAAGSMWGAWAALRGEPASLLSGALIGFNIGVLGFLVLPGDTISHVLMVLMAVSAGVLGSRLALGSRRSVSTT